MSETSDNLNEQTYSLTVIAGAKCICVQAILETISVVDHIYDFWIVVEPATHIEV